MAELSCEMQRDCRSTVTHIDRKGFVYCTHHGVRRRMGSFGVQCRKLRLWEIKKLKNGGTIAHY